MDFNLRYWLPYELKFENGAWQCLWIFVGNHHFNEPFFDETITLLKAKKGSSRFISCTSLHFLLALETPLKTITPQSFIFHVSRCGSTLLSQALSTEKSHIVVPEAPIFDQILRMQEQDKNLSEIEVEKIFKKVVEWYGQDRTNAYQRYFIKLDSWHIHFYERLRNWFPETPFYFLTREPHAIITSHIKRRGIHAIPNYINPLLLNISISAAHYENFNHYTELVINNFYQKNIAVLKHKHPLNYFYDYSFGIKNMLYHFWDKVLMQKQVFENSLSRTEKHSKDATLAFNGDEKVNYHIINNCLTDSYHDLLQQIKSHYHG